MAQKLRIPAALLRVLCVALLVVCVCWSWTNLYIVSHTLLDADASSELVYSNLLAEEGGLFLSTNWIYSTELRVMSTQLVYTPLFHIFSDWTTVRFVGVAILQLLMLGAYGYMAHESRMSFNSFCVTASALILPMSVFYGRIVLYHAYYIAYITMGYLLVGLYLSVADHSRWTGKGLVWAWVRTVLMVGLAFASGLGSIRQLMITAFPVLVAAALLAIGKEKPGVQGTLWQRLHGLVLAAALFAGCGAGYLVNTAVLAKIYTFQDYSQMMLMSPDFGTLNRVLIAFLEQFGYVDGATMFSAEGLVGLGAVVMTILALILGAHTVRHSEDDAARFLQLFALMANVVMVVVFLLVNGDYVYTLYLLPVTPWIIAALGKVDLTAARPQREGHSLPMRLLGSNAPRLSVTKLAATIAVIPMIAAGFYTSTFFRDPENSGIAYAGLNYNETDDVQRLTPVCDFLRENGYTLGYASYWNGSLVTELTDGACRVVPLQMTESQAENEYCYLPWLSDLRLRSEDYIAQQKVFLLLDLSEDYGFEDTGVLYERAEKVYDSLTFVVYTFSDPLTVHQYVTGQLSSGPVYEEDEW